MSGDGKLLFRLVAMICVVAMVGAPFSGRVPAAIAGVLLMDETQSTSSYEPQADPTASSSPLGAGRPRDDIAPDVPTDAPEVPGGEDEQVSPVVPYEGRVVPDIHAFSGGRMLEYDAQRVTGGTKYIVWNDDDATFLDEYIQLLGEDLRQVGYREVSGISSYEFGFVYTGSDQGWRGCRGTARSAMGRRSVGGPDGMWSPK